jgi:tetratricopeptide (TPR) repeat protein
MPGTEDLDRLLIIAGDAEEKPQWSSLARYYRLRTKGLRRDAFAALDDFLSEAVQWAFADRLSLCLWLASHLDDVWGQSLVAPHPVDTKIVTPTLLEWVAAEPMNADAHYWAGQLASDFLGDVSRRPHHFRRAVALDPMHDPARLALARWLESGADYAQHHLPDFYIGDVEKDLRNLREAISLIEPVRDQASIDFLRTQIQRLTDIALEWRAFKAAGGGDFARWCAQAGKDQWFHVW